MEKRTIIAIILSLVILVFYQEVIMKRILKQVPSTQIVEKENKIYKSEKKDFNSNTSKKTPIKERTNFENKKSDRVKQEVIKNINEKLITIENDLFILTFSNRGGAVQRCILKKYFETVHKRKNVVLFDRIKGYEIENEITFDNFFIKKDEIYNVNISDKELYVENKPINIVFTYSNNQLTVKKIYTVFPNKYEVKLTYEILNKTGKNLNVINKTFFYRTKKERKSRYQFEGPCFLVDGVLKEVPVKKLEKEPYRSYSKNLKWYAYSEVYFISVILKKDEFFDKAKTYLKGKDVVIEGEKKFPVRVNENYSDINYLYFGPKKYDILKSYHAGLERSIDYGIFDFLAKPLVMLLNFFYKYVHNYGIAILLLTLLIKLLFYPLTQKSYESMKKMKDLQPHLQTLKEKYKNDKAKLNQAIMELYKKHKVNPFGGCLPILIQIPVFFALYKALLASIELRHAPFIKYLPFTDKLWLIDLSAKDPYYITPILMGLSMFIQQKMTPTGGDAMQEKLMYIMPIVLTFLFLNFPSGLVVYWLANNVLSIIQQYYVNKKMS